MCGRVVQVQMRHRMHSSTHRELTMDINLAPFEEMDRGLDERTTRDSIGKMACDSVEAQNADTGKRHRGVLPVGMQQGLLQ
jgi:hypothetical protein